MPTIKISQQMFAERRRKLMAQMSVNSVAIIPSANLQTRNSDVEYAFRQDSHWCH